MNIKDLKVNTLEDLLLANNKLERNFTSFFTTNNLEKLEEVCDLYATRCVKFDLFEHRLDVTNAETDEVTISDRPTMYRIDYVFDKDETSKLEDPWLPMLLTTEKLFNDPILTIFHQKVINKQILTIPQFTFID